MRRRKRPYLILSEHSSAIPECLETSIVVGLTGYANRSSLADAVKNGRFPPPVKTGRRAVRWRTADILPFINGRDA